MDRIDDTVSYLNGMILRYNCNGRAAFDFYNFINNSYVIIESLKTLARIFYVDDNDIRKITDSNTCFGEYYDKNVGADEEFYKYIRSLCAVHPTDTTGHKKFMNNANIHCCPYVIWNDKYSRIIHKDEYELSVRIYNSSKSDFGEHIYLRVCSFEKYLNKWLDFSKIIIRAIENYYNSEFEKSRQIKLKAKEEFCDYTDFIRYLKEQNEKRFNNGEEYMFDYYIQVFNTKLSNSKNDKKFECYKNAIKLAMDFKYKSLQDMEVEGYEYTGIKNPIRSCDNSLFYELYRPESISNEFRKYAYNLEKMCYLDNTEVEFSSNDKHWARVQLDLMKDLINKYVVFSNTEPDMETIILVNIALYYCNLENDSDLNNNIVQDKMYRDK